MPKSNQRFSTRFREFVFSGTIIQNLRLEVAKLQKQLRLQTALSETLKSELATLNMRVQLLVKALAKEEDWQKEKAEYTSIEVMPNVHVYRHNKTKKLACPACLETRKTISTLQHFTMRSNYPADDGGPPPLKVGKRCFFNNCEFFYFEK